MDRKSIILLTLCFVLILAWEPLMRKFYPPPAHPVVTAPATPATATPGATQSATSADIPSMGSPTASSKPVAPSGPEELLTVTNDDARYVFTSRGGGLKEVQLLRYPAATSSRRTKNRNTNEVATLNDSLLPAVFSIYAGDVLPGDANFKLTRAQDGVRAENTFPNGLTVIKEFHFDTNYLMNVSVRLENHSPQSLALPPQLWVAGAATPMDPLDNGMWEMVFWYNGAKASSVPLTYFDTNTSRLYGLISRTPQTIYTSGTNNVAWVSVQNQFFSLATMPEKPAAGMEVHMVFLPPAAPEEIAANPAVIRNPMALQATLAYPALTLAPGQSTTNLFALFAGPKEYQTLAHLAARFNNDIDLIMNFGWVGPISKALLVTMNALHSALSVPYGWLIVAITVVIKLVFWPLTAASVRSSKRMQALQPQLKALQEKYKDDPQKATAKQWEFYKKNKVNPLSGCLPAFLQIPVFCGFYYMLRGAIELRGAPFLWIGDLSKPDTVLSIPLPMLNGGYLPVNPMPLIMGATLLWGASMTPPSPSMDPAQQKMMKYMPLIMLVFMYNLSSGLALYWTVSNLLSVVQNKMTRAQTAADDTPKSVVSGPPQKKKKD